MRYPLPRHFSVSFQDLRVEADGLVRPECVLTLSSGELVASHGQGGYSVVPANRALPPVHVTPDGSGVHMANGIALAPDGIMRFADLGNELGGVFAIDGRGKVTPDITVLSQGALTAEDMQSAGSSRLGNISSLAFGGKGLRTVYLGCLLDNKNPVLCIAGPRCPPPTLGPQLGLSRPITWPRVQPHPVVNYQRRTLITCVLCSYPGNVPRP
jgi:hypothetical protein